MYSMHINVIKCNEGLKYEDLLVERKDVAVALTRIDAQTLHDRYIFVVYLLIFLIPLLICNICRLENDELREPSIFQRRRSTYLMSFKLKIHLM